MSADTMSTTRPPAVAEPRLRLAALAHELRTPLTSVEGWVELLLDGSLGPLTAEQRRAVGAIRFNTERVRARVAGLVAPQRSVDVAAVVRAALDVVGPAARLAGLAVHDDVPSTGGLLATVDEAALERALLSVLRTAVRHTPAGGRLLVSAFADAGGGDVVVEVVDTGPGVPQVHEVMAVNGCRLSLGPGPGGGTTVRLHLQAAQPAHAGMPDAPARFR